MKCVYHRHHMALHIERVPLSSARKATKVLQLCLKFQLKEQGTHYPVFICFSLPHPLPLFLSPFPSPLYLSPECVPCDVHERVPQWPTGGSSLVVPPGQRCRLRCISCREVSVAGGLWELLVLSLPSQIFCQLPEPRRVHGP